MRLSVPSLLIAGMLTLGATAPSAALCLLCNASVRLDSGLAACFAERSEDELKTLAQSGKDFVIIDLASCSSRGGLPTGQAADMPLDTEFAADAQAIRCLSAAIAALDDTALTPSHVFDLTKDCPAP